MSGWVSVAVLPLLTECTGTVVAAAAIHAIHLEHPLRLHVPACARLFSLHLLRHRTP